ncbi:glycosyltransferase family 4 protein [Glaciecola sp. 2405UD65-10]|uniref:glycosyltransferase family 4 protein n=1 Tax=Glaciecola sp. 2405UD65-10 TaxID=3397244 RepID=UPI003B5986E3
MKILLMTDALPFPLDHGLKLRVFNFCRELYKIHEIDLLCYDTSPLPEELAPLFHRVFQFEKPKANDTSNNIVHKVLNPFSYEGLVRSSEDAKLSFPNLINEYEYDLIWVYRGMMTTLPEKLNTPVVADIIDDYMLDYWRRLKAATKLVDKAKYYKWYKTVCSYEREVFSRATRLVFASSPDAEACARQLKHTPCDVVSNGVDVNYYNALEGIQKDPNLIVFEGKMDFAPNEDGMLFFCEEVFPKILKIRPQTKLRIVGKNPTPAISALASPNIEVTGFVDDVRTYVQEASVFVCPLRFGSGVKNKILQAWSLGMPVVGTTKTTGGINAIDGQNMLIEDDASQFAIKVCDLLDDTNMQAKLGANARRDIVADFSWQTKSKELNALFEEAVR